MTKSEIKEIVKQVYKEEQEYQQLFKTMLSKSGKDIGSMSDTDKKKFFNAVDKAYKAKSEGKLTQKQPINEIVAGYYLYLFVKVFFFFITSIAGYILHIKNKKVDAEALEVVAKELENNDSFIKKAGEILAKEKNINGRVSVEIAELPEANAAYNKGIMYIRNKYKGEKSTDVDSLQLMFSDILEKAWKNPTMQNMILQKIKNKLS